MLGPLEVHLKFFNHHIEIHRNIITFVNLNFSSWSNEVGTLNKCYQNSFKKLLSLLGDICVWVFKVGALGERE